LKNLQQANIVRFATDCLKEASYCAMIVIRCFAIDVTIGEMENCGAANSIQIVLKKEKKTEIYDLKPLR